MSWKELEERDPQMAALGFERLNRKIAYLATIKKDGSPRLHPVTPFIGNGMLFMFTEPSSPKNHDLRTDNRYALHCSVNRKEGESLIEFLVSGVAKVISNADIRRQAAEGIASSPDVVKDYVLFEFQVENVLLVKYDDEGKRTIQRWHFHVPCKDGRTISVDGSAGSIEAHERID